MQDGSFPSFGAEASGTSCTFCQRSDFAAYVLKETPAFFIATDHAPLVEGHLLIIPKHHYACYGAIPAELDAELFALKREVQEFLGRYYAPVVFWEHGIFRQTVFHAHLHCFPFGAIELDLSQDLHDIVVHSREDVRRWYAEQGPYFYVENAHTALLFAPETEHYFQVIRSVFAQGVASHGGRAVPRSPEQRRKEGGPLIKATIARWTTWKKGVPGEDVSDCYAD